MPDPGTQASVPGASRSQAEGVPSRPRQNAGSDRVQCGGSRRRWLLGASIIVASEATATQLFFDDFTNGASPAWGNERGSWRALNGTYDATFPSNSPLTYSSVTTLPSLTDFTAQVTVNDLNDGGIWLRSSFNGGAINGILLVTGGFTGTFNGLYFHEVHNGVTGAALNAVSVPGLQGSNVDLRVVVAGNTYSVFLGGATTPVTTLVDAAFSSGSFGLYDFSPLNGASSPRGENFDNISIDASLGPAVPEPTSLALLATGLVGIGILRRRNRVI